MTKLQQQLAEQFLHILEEEKLDWRKEWSGIPERPYNPISKTVYHGSNYFSLLLTSMVKGYQVVYICADQRAGMDIESRKRTECKNRILVSL